MFEEDEEEKKVFTYEFEHSEDFTRISLTIRTDDSMSPDEYVTHVAEFLQNIEDIMQFKNLALNDDQDYH